MIWIWRFQTSFGSMVPNPKLLNEGFHPLNIRIMALGYHQNGANLVVADLGWVGLDLDFLQSCPAAQSILSNFHLP